MDECGLRSGAARLLRTYICPVSVPSMTEACASSPADNVVQDYFVVVDSEGGRPLSRRVANDEPELPELSKLLADALALADDVA